MSLASVFCRFHEPKRAWEGTYCNNYSGKWNFHYGGSLFLAYGPKQVAEFFIDSISTVYSMAA
mgnify:CR=1 FL=1